MEMTPENLAMLFPIPKRVLKRFEVGDIYHTFSETHYPAEYVVIERIKQSVKIRRRRYDINDGCGYETIFDMKIHTNASAKVPMNMYFVRIRTMLLMLWTLTALINMRVVSLNMS